jgi:hypothetical protein
MDNKECEERFFFVGDGEMKPDKNKNTPHIYYYFNIILNSIARFYEYFISFGYPYA